MCKPSPFKIPWYLLYAIFFLCSSLPVYSFNYQANDSILTKQRTFSAEELIRGERLFYGLVYLENKSVNCSGCHITTRSDTINWNPDALEISMKYLNRSAADLSKVLITPTGQKMAQVHKGFTFTPEDIVLIKAYLDKVTRIGLRQYKPVVTNLLLFLIASVLVLFSFTDLIITKKIKKQWIHFVILTVTLLFISKTLVVDAIALGRSKDYSPDQPVKFSHAVHAGQNATDCIYCHSTAHYSKTAGIPPENVCMNCHLLVRNGTRSGMFEISKVTTAYDSLKPIGWIRVYNLPDHVFFSHAQHVEVGGLKCQECHGAVETMDRIKQVPDLSMGWCINCHRARKVTFQTNKFYQEYRDLSEKMLNGAIDSVTVEMTGGTECMRCHY